MRGKFSQTWIVGRREVHGSCDGSTRVGATSKRHLHAQLRQGNMALVRTSTKGAMLAASDVKYMGKQATEETRQKMGKSKLHGGQTATIQNVRRHTDIGARVDITAR